jgi:mevalonate kinase
VKTVLASAPGKIILFGEHAVVYGRPAIAVPVLQVHADVAIEAAPEGQVKIDAADVGRVYDLGSASPDDPIATLIRLTCARLGVETKSFSVRIRSTVPVARGLGSGAAVSVATARALGEFFRHPLSRAEVSALAYEIERLHHGTPSGIDNTVIAYAQPVYFARDHPFESFHVPEPFEIAIADTGVASSTKIAVGDVRRAWEADRRRYETLFDEIQGIVDSARAALERGDMTRVGSLMNENQERLEAIGVSSPEIRTLTRVAVKAGAVGAKLSGGGRGGNVIALVDAESRKRVVRALAAVGAVRVIVTRVE